MTSNRIRNYIPIIIVIQDMLDMNQLTLKPGDVMFLYTDGITEATDDKGEMYSDEKLGEVFKKLAHLPPVEIKNGILESLNNYICEDDVTMMILKKI